MGKRNTLKSKSGRRELNPTDAFRKQQRNREKKRNRRERQKVREEARMRKNPTLIKEELGTLKQQDVAGKLDARGMKRLEHLELLWLTVQQRVQAEKNAQELRKLSPHDPRFQAGGSRLDSEDSSSESSGSDGEDGVGDDDSGQGARKRWKKFFPPLPSGAPPELSTNALPPPPPVDDDGAVYDDEQSTNFSALPPPIDEQFPHQLPQMDMSGSQFYPPPPHAAGFGPSPLVGVPPMMMFRPPHYAPHGPPMPWFHSGGMPHPPRAGVDMPFPANRVPMGPPAEEGQAYRAGGAPPPSGGTAGIGGTVGSPGGRAGAGRPAAPVADNRGTALFVPTQLRVQSTKPAAPAGAVAPVKRRPPQQGGGVTQVTSLSTGLDRLSRAAGGVSAVPGLKGFGVSFGLSSKTAPEPRARNEDIDKVFEAFLLDVDK